MFFVVFVSILATAIAGLIIMKILQINGDPLYQIDWREYGIGMAASLVIAVLVSWLGWMISRDNLIKFNEYWNGWEVAAIKEPITCSRDGPCSWDYDCDPYIVMVECNCSTDSKGNSHCSTCLETRYHSCPYVDVENNYYVNTTLEQYTIAKHVFPENPQAHRWRRSESIPQSVIESAGTGDPQFWVVANKRCLTGQPGPVSVRREYSNYILASDHTLMKEHSSDVAYYQSLHLLPAVSSGINGIYHTNKVYFIGWQPKDTSEWMSAVEYLDAALGYQLQGDLHLVVVKNKNVSDNPERYALALKAYWQDKKIFEQNSLSKNAVAVIVGTEDGQTVSWSRAITGMPLGNEKLIVYFRDGLRGVSLTADALIGPAVSVRDNLGTHLPYDKEKNAGVIGRAVLGLDDPSTRFKRISMSGKDGQGGFLYLKNEIQPTNTQTWVIFFVAFLISCCAWVWGAIHDDRKDAKKTYYGRY